jgi:hypothetical protein
MPSRSEFADRHELTLGGVTYAVAVRRRDDRYYASWECMACHEISVTKFEGSTPEEAASFAGANIGVHHGHAHRKPPEAPAARQLPRTSFPSSMPD